jgi:glucose-1-phosphate thymidylyltransferase
MQHRQGLLIGCLEEVAWQKKFIRLDQLKSLASKYGKSPYGLYLLRLVDEQHGDAST